MCGNDDGSRRTDPATEGQHVYQTFRRRASLPYDRRCAERVFPPVWRDRRGRCYPRQNHRQIERLRICKYFYFAKGCRLDRSTPCTVSFILECSRLQVTMKDREGAEKACANPNPVVDGRRANVNLAYLGAKPKSHSHPGMLYS